MVALAGATGSGKSSLFNAIVGEQVARIGARRPTTSVPSAAVWGTTSATELLDWLSVSSRHQVDGAKRMDDADAAGSDGVGSDGLAVTGPAGSLDGLVLLDLPDFDSRVDAHRIEAQRVLELVDIFVLSLIHI